MYVPMLLLGGLHIEMARRWSMEEEAAVERQLNGFLQTMKVPMLLLGGLHVEMARQWSMEEKAAVERQLNRFLQTMKVSGKRDCEEALENEGAL